MCFRVKRTLLFTAASPYLPSRPLSQQRANPPPHSPPHSDPSSGASGEDSDAARDVSGAEEQPIGFHPLLEGNTPTGSSSSSLCCSSPSVSWPSMRVTFSPPQASSTGQVVTSPLKTGVPVWPPAAEPCNTSRLCATAVTHGWGGSSNHGPGAAHFGYAAFAQRCDLNTRPANRGAQARIPEASDSDIDSSLTCSAHGCASSSHRGGPPQWTSHPISKPCCRVAYPCPQSGWRAAIGSAAGGHQARGCAHHAHGQASPACLVLRGCLLLSHGQRQLGVSTQQVLAPALSISLRWIGMAGSRSRPAPS